MTDDQIAALLKPKQNWLAIAGFVVAAATTAGAVAKWAYTTPTRDEIKTQSDEIVRIRIELPTMSAKIQRVEESQQRIEKAVEQVSNKLDDRKGRGR